MSALPAGDALLLAQIERILQEHIGLDVTTVGSTFVERAVQHRMRACGARDMGDFVARIGVDEAELRELVEAVVVPETYFFREPEALHALAERVMAGSVRATADAPLRVLSAPCSTGEEPYSIAMTLLAAGIAPAALAIDAVDLSHDAVRRARAGLYRGSSFRGSAFDWQPYFDRTPRGEYQLQARVRDHVRVEQANLFDSAFRPPRGPYDVVFCRNLLIYFDADAQERVLATLTTLLTSRGTLVVGAADSFAVRRAGYVPVEGAERAFLFHYRGVEPEAAAASASDTRRSIPVAVRRTGRPPRAPGAPVRRAAAARAPSPLDISADAPAAESELRLVARLADDGRLAEAVQAGEAAIAAATANADLLALLGTVHVAQGQDANAERCYRRALYLDPGHADALLHLALIVEGRGDADGARLLRARARRSDAVSRGSGA